MRQSTHRCSEFSGPTHSRSSRRSKGLPKFQWSCPRQTFVPEDTKPPKLRLQLLLTCRYNNQAYYYHHHYPRLHVNPFACMSSATTLEFKHAATEGVPTSEHECLYVLQVSFQDYVFDRHAKYTSLPPGPLLIVVPAFEVSSHRWNLTPSNIVSSAGCITMQH